MIKFTQTPDRKALSMKNYVIVTDHSAALSTALMKRYHIAESVYLHINRPDGSSFLSDRDWKMFTPDQFFGQMANKKQIYRTSAANIEEIKAIFEPHLKAGEDILSINISHALSGTYDHVYKAAEELRAAYPGSKIVVIDSLVFGPGLTLLAIRAAINRDNGMSLEDNAKWLEENKIRVHEAGPMDDLFFLARQGRINHAAAFFGTMAGVKPMGEFGDNGMTTVIYKAKGYKKAMKVAIAYIKETIVEPEKQVIFIGQSYRKEQAEEFAELIREEIQPRDVVVLSIDMSTGSNLGPGLNAAYYFGKPRSAGLVEEKAIIERVAA